MPITGLLFAAIIAGTPIVAGAAERWQRIEADNGAASAIELNSVASWSTGEVYAIICALDGDVCPLSGMRRVLFDCRGHYTPIDFGGVSLQAPPRSVIGRLADIACTAKSRNPASRNEGKKPAMAMYEARYTLAGFLLRAGKVCTSDSQPNIDAGFSLLDSSELKQISKSYPETIQSWMMQGADNFNAGVMKDGMKVACAYAVAVRRRVEEGIASERTPR
jgi:hypothetical protein